jgi:superfamily II DNA/RNA helicase
MFNWSNFPKNSIIIFDEAHKCKQKTSINAKLLMSLKRYNIKVILLSATISDTSDSFHVFGYIFDFYKNIKNGTSWINATLREDKNLIDFSKQISSINKQIYPNKGSRMKICEISDKFPKNQISADPYTISISDSYMVNNLIDEIKKYKSIDIENLSIETTTTVNKSFHLEKLMKARQALENIKIKIIINLVEDYLSNDYSVVVFVNFNNTLDVLSKYFMTTCLIRGDQDNIIRQRNIDNFQSNNERLILCNIKAGGVSISLHDLHGVPRVSIISPSYSSIELVQALGRISRSNAKTPALQRIVYCANTHESDICDKINKKIKFMTKLNDGDLL